VTLSKNKKPKVSMTEKRAKKQECLERILASHFVESGEYFSVADVAAWLGVEHTIARYYLNELADGSKLAQRQSSGGELVFAKKPSPLLKKAWRTRSDRDVGI